MAYRILDPDRNRSAKGGNRMTVESFRVKVLQDVWRMRRTPDRKRGAGEI
jgi:hypothetical protein